MVWCGAVLNIEGCGAVRAPALNDCAVRVQASSLRGGAVVGQTFRPAQGSSAQERRRLVFPSEEWVLTERIHRSGVKHVEHSGDRG